MSIYRSQERHFDEVQHAGIALSPKARHRGVLFRDEEVGRAEFLHLAWHLDFNREFPQSHYVWIQPRIPPFRLRQVSAVCRRIWTANQDGKLPYGFSDPRDSFEDNGQLQLGQERCGLTCASFVLAVYDRAGLPLLKYETWVGRPEDIQWQQWVICNFEEAGVNPAHIEAVRNEIGLVRYRPVEVAGAAIAETIPASFDKAVEKGREILDFLGIGDS